MGFEECTLLFHSRTEGGQDNTLAKCALHGPCVYYTGVGRKEKRKEKYIEKIRIWEMPICCWGRTREADVGKSGLGSKMEVFVGSPFPLRLIPPLTTTEAGVVFPPSLSPLSLLDFRQQPWRTTPPTASP